MDTTHELDPRIASDASEKANLPVKVRIAGQVLELNEVVVGLDFVMGATDQSLYFLPLTSVIEISELETSSQKQVFLSDLLSAQKQPLLIHYRIAERTCSAWLLNISMPWLRLAHPQGIIWVPFSRVEFALLVSPGPLAKARAA